MTTPTAGLHSFWKPPADSKEMENPAAGLCAAWTERGVPISSLARAVCGRLGVYPNASPTMKTDSLHFLNGLTRGRCGAPRVPFLAALAAFAFCGAAQAAITSYVVTVDQVGANVVATGFGVIDLNTLTLITDGTGGSIFVDASDENLVIGPADSNLAVYDGASLVPNFGPGGLHGADTGNGDYVGLAGTISSSQVFFLPEGYSGGTLSSTATWDNETFAGLGLTQGVYSSTWDSGDGNFIVEIGTPEPSTFWMLALALTAVLLRGWFRKTRTAENAP